MADFVGSGRKWVEYEHRQMTEEKITLISLIYICVWHVDIKVYWKSTQSIKNYREEMDKLGLWLHYKGQYKIKMKDEFFWECKYKLQGTWKFTWFLPLLLQMKKLKTRKNCKANLSRFTLLVGNYLSNSSLLISSKIQDAVIFCHLYLNSRLVRYCVCFFFFLST